MKLLPLTPPSPRRGEGFYANALSKTGKGILCERLLAKGEGV